MLWSQLVIFSGTNFSTTRLGALSLTPRFRVVSLEISEELGGRLVIEASQAGAIVVGDEGVEVGVAFGMIVKAAVGAQLRSAFEMLAEAAVEALDHAICLRPKGLGEAVINLMAGTGAIERMLARGLVVGFGFLVDGKAIGEFGAVVGQHGVDGERKTVEKALQESRSGVRPAIGEDLEVDKAGGAVDRDPSLRWGRL